MAENTNIEWADATFNPWIGCTRVSPGCDDCYAARCTPARALGVAWGTGEQRRRTSRANWKLPELWNREHVAFALMHGRRRRVFCASLSDFLDNEVPEVWLHDLFALIDSTPNLDWLLLTKRIGNAQRIPGAALWPSNVSLGVTVVNQAEADRDIPKLLQVPVPRRFLSIEPMLGLIDAKRWLSRLDWVIVGGESGPKARPMHPDWVRSMRDQCASAGVPFFFKQWGEWAPYGRGSIDSSTLQTPDALDEPIQRFGKKSAGRLLDGRHHSEWPRTTG